MILIQEPQAWLPLNHHGVFSFPDGADAETTIMKGLKASRILSQIPPFDTIKYSIQYNVDGSRSLFFEVLS